MGWRLGVRWGWLVIGMRGELGGRREGSRQGTSRREVKSEEE